MKCGLYIAILLSSAAVPSIAHAEDKPSQPTIQVTVSTSSRYVFETQAAVVSRNPVINVNVDWNQSKNLSGFVWGQVGDKNGREIDVGEAAHFDLGHGVEAHGMVAGYFYPDGYQAIYTASAGISVPVEHFTVSVDVQRYIGGLKTTKFTAAVSRTVKIGPVDVDLTVGKAWNTQDFRGVNPWYGHVSVPLGKHGPVLGFRGFVGAGSGGVVDLTYRF
jgi:hypothetical protein